VLVFKRPREAGQHNAELQTPRLKWRNLLLMAVLGAVLWCAILLAVWEVWRGF
jgi:hypothetical protein